MLGGRQKQTVKGEIEMYGINNVFSPVFAIRESFESPNLFGRLVFSRTVRAVGYAFFEFLQLHGFGFLHPLKPVVPEQLVLKSLNVKETPRWSFRGPICNDLQSILQ